MKTGFKIFTAIMVVAILLTSTLTGNVVMAQEPPNQDEGAVQQFFWEALAGKLGIGVETVQSYIVAAAKEALSRGVQEGKLTQEQADRISSLLDERGAQAIFMFGHIAKRRQQAAGLAGMRIALETAATTLGMTNDELLAEMQAGKTLGQLADEKGVSRDALVKAMKDAMKAAVDQAVAEGRITQEQADEFKARIDQREIDLDKSFGAGRPGGRGGTLGRGIALDAAATTLGLSTDELLTEMRAGKTLGQLADEKGVNRDALVEAIKDALKQQVDKAVEEGRLTQEKADELKARIDQREIDLDKSFGLRQQPSAP
jgi:uncharacterized protein YidB (DUF937 family)